MSRRALIILAGGIIIVVGAAMAMFDQAEMSADGDHPTPPVRDQQTSADAPATR